MTVGVGVYLPNPRAAEPPTYQVTYQGSHDGRRRHLPTESGSRRTSEYWSVRRESWSLVSKPRLMHPVIRTQTFH